MQMFCTGLLLWAQFQYSVPITKRSVFSLVSGNHDSMHTLYLNILQIKRNPKQHSETAWLDFWVTAISFTVSGNTMNQDKEPADAFYTWTSWSFLWCWGPRRLLSPHWPQVVTRCSHPEPGLKKAQSHISKCWLTLSKILPTDPLLALI